jgi:hypothetical protein
MPDNDRGRIGGSSVSLDGSYEHVDFGYPARVGLVVCEFRGWGIKFFSLDGRGSR